MLQAVQTHQAQVDVGALEAVQKGLAPVPLPDAHGRAFHLEVGVEHDEGLVRVRGDQLLHLMCVGVLYKSTDQIPPSRFTTTNIHIRTTNRQDDGVPRTVDGLNHEDDLVIGGHCAGRQPSEGDALFSFHVISCGWVVCG